MADCQLTLTSEERELLIDVLEDVLRDIRVEEHRTRAPSYREHILHREDLITDLMNRLDPSRSSSPSRT